MAKLNLSPYSALIEGLDFVEFKKLRGSISYFGGFWACLIRA